MIIKATTIDGRRIEIHANSGGPRRYWVAINQQPLQTQRSLRVRMFTTPGIAWAAALKEVQNFPRLQAAHTPGYSNLGGGGPFAPGNAPRAAAYTTDLEDTERSARRTVGQLRSTALGRSTQR